MLDGSNLQSFNKLNIKKTTRSKESLLFTRASTAGNAYALRTSIRPTHDEVKANHPEYTQVHIEKFLNAFDKKLALISGTNAPLIAKAKLAGWSRAKFNYPRPTQAELKVIYPKYTDTEELAYYSAFDKKFGKIKVMEGDSTARIRRVQKNGADYALFNQARPALTKIKANHPDFTDKEVQLFLASFDKKQAELKGTNKIAITNAKQFGRSKARTKSSRPTPDQVKAKYAQFTNEQVQAYLHAFDKRRAYRSKKKSNIPKEIPTNQKMTWVVVEEQQQSLNAAFVWEHIPSTGKSIENNQILSKPNIDHEIIDAIVLEEIEDIPNSPGALLFSYKRNAGNVSSSSAQALPSNTNVAFSRPKL